MSGFPPVPTLAANVRLFTNTVLADLQDDVNEFLHGAGTPVAGSTWRVVGTEFFHDGTNYVAAVTYTGS